MHISWWPRDCGCCSLTPGWGHECFQGSPCAGTLSVTSRHKSSSVSTGERPVSCLSQMLQVPRALQKLHLQKALVRLLLLRRAHSHPRPVSSQDVSLPWVTGYQHVKTTRSISAHTVMLNANELMAESEVKCQLLSHVWLFATPWTVACRGPLPMELRQEYWSGLPFPSPEDLPDQGSNPGLLHRRQILNYLSYQGSHWGLLSSAEYEF